VCPLKPDHSTQQRWQRPLKVVGPVVAMTDLEWTVYSDIIIRDDIAAALRAARFSGAEYYPVELFTTTESPFGGRAVELRVFGWGGVAPPESGVRVLDECPHCKRQVFSGYSNPTKLFRIEEWDGSDFFIIWPLPRYVMVTERVRDHIQKAGFTGVRVRP